MQEKLDLFLSPLSLPGAMSAVPAEIQAERGWVLAAKDFNVPSLGPQIGLEVIAHQ
jgi:hypothetical protein